MVNEMAKILFGCKNGHFYQNKTQYDWFPGKNQNSKKFSAKIMQNPTTSKNHRVFLNILRGKCPQGVTKTFWGQNNIKNEICTIKLLRVQIFSKIRQLLKNLS